MATAKLKNEAAIQAACDAFSAHKAGNIPTVHNLRTTQQMAVLNAAPVGDPNSDYATRLGELPLAQYPEPNGSTKNKE